MSTSIELCTGANMPLVGLGTWTMWNKNKNEIHEAVKTALDLGYRNFDGAALYDNEKEIGSALATRIGKDIDRKDVFVTSKLWNTMHAAEDVKPACQQTLKDLGLEYMDLYLMHWPIALVNDKSGDIYPKKADGTLNYSDVTPLQAWTAMEKLVDEGLCKHIGLSNFNTKQIAEILDNCRIKPAALQIEVHPYCYPHKLINFCQENGIVVTAYSPLGAPYGIWGKPTLATVLGDAFLVSIGEKHNKTPAQVCLRFIVQRGMVVIPKSVTPSRLAENLQVFDFELSEEDMKAIDGLNKGESSRVCKLYTDVNGVDTVVGLGESTYPFIEELWF
ncbi:aldo-keto reductase family 1 member A1-A-like [Glandiceps talaboti]